MASAILSTKLFIPKPRNELVLRERLFKLLQKEFDKKLTLISAPAGFGKSTLLSSWISTSNKKVAWLSLDEGDNDPVRFLTYFVHALRSINNEIGQGVLNSLKSAQPPAIENILTLLINEIAENPNDIFLVLDDYHVIEAQPVHDILTYILDHLPPQMHLIILTRVDPALPLGRLRARGQLNELRASDLRFSTSEAAEFLNQIMHLTLSKEQISLLDNRTEGWIAGLQLAALSMQGKDDLSGFIESFTGSHRFILDYLIDEVLNNQSKSLQSFLMQTSVLDRMSGLLCNALTGKKDGQKILEELEKCNLFIIPLDDQRKWYRYHHLFAEFLRKRLEQNEPERIESLLEQASLWCENNDHMDEAIDYVLQNKHFIHAVKLIEDQAESAWQDGEQVKLDKWLDALPIQRINASPQLSIFYAWNLFRLGMTDRADSYLHKAETRFGLKDDQSAKPEAKEKTILKGKEKDKFIGGAETMRAFMAFYRSDTQAIIIHAKKALKHLDQKDKYWRNTAIISLGDAYLTSGQYDKAKKARIEALKSIDPNEAVYHYLIASLKFALTLQELGEFDQAIEICQSRLQLAIENGLSQSEVVGFLYAIWGDLLTEKNELPQALEYIKKGIQLVKIGTDIPIHSWCYICLIRVLFSQGNFFEAQKFIEKNKGLFQNSFVPTWFSHINEDWRIRIWLDQDQLDMAQNWVQENKLEPDQDHTYVDGILFISLARILITEGKHKEALDLLQRLLAEAKSGVHITRMLKIMILQVFASHAEGNIEKSNKILSQALELAYPKGFMRTFVNEGPLMENLLRNLKTENAVIKKYAHRILNTFRGDKSQQTPASQQPLIDPLSDRELEVLDLIAKGLSNQQIASKLFLSLNTIKVHTRNIYQKLSVNNRTQAVAEARDKKIIISN